MAFATDVDVETALGRSLTSTESDAVDHVLAAASDQVVGYLGRTPDPVPGAVTRVVADMVAAVFSKPSITVADYDASGYSTSREAAGVHVGTESATTTGAWLTKALKIRLRPFKRSSFSIHTVASAVEGS
jgi:hypothetical protein